MQSQGKIPKIVILKMCTDAIDAANSEVALIKIYRHFGFRLTNSTPGGTGGNTGGGQKRRRPVVATNYETGEVKVYDYIRQAEADGFSSTKIVSLCRNRESNRRITHNGFQFRYADTKATPLRQKRNCISVIATRKSDGAVSHFKNLKEAASAIGVSKSMMSNYSMGLNRSRTYDFEFSHKIKKPSLRK